MIFRKNTCLAILCLLLFVASKAQVSNYAFTALTGTYTANPAPTTLITFNQDDNSSIVTNIGFTFVYNGISYTQFVANTNGVLSFNTAAGVNNSWINDLSSGTDLRPGVAPLWDDLGTGDNTSGSNVNYQLTGIAGSRILTVEWKAMRWDIDGSSNVISFQAKLYETTNIIEFVYSQGANGINNGSGGASIGIMGATAADFISLTSTSASPGSSTTVSTNNLNSRPATNQVYRFNPLKTTVTGFSPSSGCENTTAVVITGTNFTGATAVNFGGTNAASFTVNSATQITATPSSGTTGTIQVTTPGNTATSGTSFTINQVPTGLAYTLNSTVYCIGTTIVNNIPSSGGSAVVSYSVVPVLPAGLIFSTTTGIISGTPSIATAATNYTITATNSCGSANVAVNITISPAAPTALTYTLNTPSYCVGISITNNSPSNSGGAPTVYSVSPALPAGLSLNTITGVISGTSTIATTAANYTVTASNSCGTTNFIINITVNPIPTGGLTVTEASGTTNNDNIICAGAAVTFTATPGYGAYNFKVNGTSVQNGKSNTYSSSALINGTSITVDVANGFNCGATFGPVVITVNTLPTGTLSVDKNAICSGDTATFTATGGSKYTFIVNGSAIETNSTGIFSIHTLANNASVKVDVTNANGCDSIYAPIIMNVNPLPLGTFTASSPSICTGDNVAFTATGGATYQFRINGTIIQPYSATNTFSTSTLTNPNVVTVDVRNAAGCMTTYPGISVTVNALPTGSLTATENSGTQNDNIICTGANVVFTATGGFTNYKFYLNGAGAPLQNNASNIYNSATLVDNDFVTVVVTNNNGCLATFTSPAIKVVSSPSGTLSASPSNIICAGDSVVFTATSGFANYNFKVNGTPVQNGPGSTYSNNLLSTGNSITVDVTSSNGCLSTFGPLTMIVNALPSGTLGISENSGIANGDGIICKGATVVFNAPNGFSNYNFQLNGISVPNGGLRTYTTPGLADGDKVAVAVTNAGGCIALLDPTYTITVHTLPAVQSITGALSVCVNNTTVLANTTASGVWSSFNPGIATVDAAGVVTGVSAGTATINYTVTNTFGCDSTVKALVTVNALPTVAAITGSLTVCATSTTQLSDATAAGSWSSNNTAIASVDVSGLVTGMSAGTATISYTLTNGNGCTTIAGAVVTVNALPVVAAITTTAPSFEVCVSSAITLADATSGGTWTSSNTSVATINVSGIVTGGSNGTSTISYAVTTNGCTTTVTQVVTVHALPVPTLSGPNPICPNATDTYITEAGQTNYNWTFTGGTLISGGTVTDNTITIKWDQPGTRTIFVNYKNAFGCTGAASATVTTSTGTAPTLSGPAAICLNSPGTYATQAGETAYSWTVSGGTITSGGTATDNTATINWNVAGAGSAGINFTDVNGCTSSAPKVLPVTVNPLPTATISGTTTVCLNGAAPSITFTGGTGSAPYTFNYNIDGVAQSSIATTSGNSKTITAATATAGISSYNLVSVSDNNTCPQNQSGTVTITINPASSGGSVSAAATVCSGNNSGTINLTGETGVVIRWESSADAGTTWIQINNTTSSLIYTNLTQTTSYRAVVQSGACASVNSAVSTITVNPVSIGGAAGVSTSVCSGTNSGTINLTGQTGPVTGWESSIDGGTTWLPIGNTTTSLIYNNLTQTSMYMAVVQSGVCASANSSAATIAVNSVSVGGAVGVSTTVCSGSNSGTLNVAGQTGAIARWESSIDAGTTWAPIANTTTSLTYNNITQSTQYRAVVQSGACAPANSSAAIITVNAATAGGAAAANATVCAGTNGATINLTGQTGSVIRWEFSIDGGTNWSPISNTATSQTYTNLTQTTLYRAVVQSGVCALASSTSATINVNSHPTGFLSGTQGICNGAAATLTITVTGSGTISGTLSDGSIFSGTAPTITVSVSPAVNTTYTIATLSDANCSANAGDKTGSAAVTVNGATPITSVQASPATICLGSSGNLFIPSGTASIMSENFEGTNTFNVVNTVPNTAASAWTLSPNGYSHNYSCNSSGLNCGSTVTFNSGSAHYMLTISDNQTASNNPVNTALVSPTISTVGYTSLNFQYRTYYQQYPSDIAVVEVSTNNGASWTVIQNLTATGTIGTQNNFSTQNINLNAYINNASFNIRFRYTTNNSWWWAIDDINLTGTTVAVGNYSWTAFPAATAGLPAGAGTPAAANANIVVIPTATGPTVYTATLTNGAGCTSTKNITVTVNSSPVVTIVADYCAVAGKVKLTATATAGSALLWSTGETTPSINVDIAAIYQVTATSGGCSATASISVAQELVVNGNFDAGNTGFTSPPLGANQYKYVADNPAINTELQPEGLYGIGPEPQNYHSNFWGHDHTTGSGNFMIINGFPNGNPQPIVWQETVAVLPNTTYYFSAWGMSLNNVGPFAQLQFNVGGSQVGSVATLAAGVTNNTNNGWTRFYGTWLSGPATTTAIISINDLQNQRNGNDFGLDDISFATLSTFVQQETVPGTEAQTTCINTPVIPVVYSVGSSASAPTVTGLPPGITAVFNGVLFTISGTPTVAGNYAYTVTTTGSCNPVSASGTIKVQSQTIGLSSGSSSPTICVNTPVNIGYALGGSATGATVTGLPAGVTLSVIGTAVTLSGTPTLAGTYPYIIATTGTCTPDTASGTITVQSQTITLSSGNASQTICINTPAINIQYTVGGTGNGASASGLPPGVTGSYISGLFIISGTPTSAAGSPYNYTVTTSGTSCTPVSVAGIITVTPAASLNLTSGAGTNTQTVCEGAAITGVTYIVSNATSASVSGLPANVTGAFNAGVFTISGTPSAGGIFNYTIITSGGCGSATATGTITVQEQTVTLTSGIASPSICSNTLLSNIVYTMVGTATTATVTGLPTGITGSLSGNAFTISGIPIVLSGSFPYTVTSSGSCGQMSSTGTITVKPAAAGGTVSSVSICSGGSGTLTLAGQVGTIVRWEFSTDGGTTWTAIANTTNTQVYNSVTVTTFYRVVVSNGCGPVFSSVATVGVHNLWTGATGTDWNTAANWSDNQLPSTSCPDAYIPNTPNKPILGNGTGTINNLHIYSGATLTVNGTGTLQIGGTITSSGTFDVSNGALEFNGTSSQTIGSSTFMNHLIHDLVISNSTATGVTLGGPLDVSRSLTYNTAGATLNTGGFLTLKSTITETAWLGDMTGHTINGDVTVERYIATGTGSAPNHGKSWQLLAIPTTGQSINQAWQEGATTLNENPNPGYGTQITGSAGTAAGFDVYTATPSMKIYNSLTNGYDGESGTQIPIYNQKGYFVFVRGDRSVIASNASATPTILRTKGTLFTPANLPPVTTVAADKFASVGNPYASALDMRNIIKSANVNDVFQVWDPQLGGGSNYGAFQTFIKNFSTGNYEVNPGNGSYGAPGSVNNFIQSGQAFIVQTTGGSGTISFAESSKAGGSALFSRPNNVPHVQQQLRTGLYAINADGSTALVDGVLSNFDDSYSNAVDGLDAKKSFNMGENLSIKTGGQLLVIERKHSITLQDTIFLNLTGTRVQQYQFRIDADNLNAGIEGFLEDNYLHTRTSINLGGSTLVNFNIVNIAGSYANDRFRIVFAPEVVLPVTFTSVKAYRQDKIINVEWTVENEMNMKQYEVEKSTNGTAFTTLAVKAASVNGGHSAMYVTADVNPQEGYNYYRVKSVDINGKAEYTGVVKVQIGSLKQDITIYPNPITDGTIHLQLMNQPEGAYGIRLLNKTGQVILSKQISHADGSSTELIKWDYNLAHGMYQLEVSRPDRSVKDINVMY